MKDNAKITGIYAAIATPMLPNEDIDYAMLKKLVDYCVDGGIQGIMLGGNTGEFPLLDKEERKELVKKTVEFADGRIKICACCSMNTTRDTMDLVRYGNEAGADYVILAVPYDMPTSFKCIREYYEEAARISDVGVCLYHYPAYTNVHLTPHEIAELAQIDNIVGMKNAVDIDELMQLLYLNERNNNDTFGVLCAYDRQVMPGLAGGAVGFMGAGAGIVPSLFSEMYKLACEGKFLEARAVSRKIEPVLGALYDDVAWPGAAKQALEILGLPCGLPRRPLEVADAGHADVLKAAFVEAGVL